MPVEREGLYAGVYAQLVSIHVGDVGTVLRAVLVDDDGVVDLSTASTLELNFFKPDRTTVTKTASLSTDGADGALEYISEADFFDLPGRWLWQPYTAFSDSSTHWQKKSFIVFSNIG